MQREEVGVVGGGGARCGGDEGAGVGGATASAAGSGSVRLEFEFGVGGVGVGFGTERASHLGDAAAIVNGLNVDNFSHLIKQSGVVHGDGGKSQFLLLADVWVG